MSDVKADNDFKSETQECAVGVLRSLSTLSFLFELNFNLRYYRAMAFCNSKLQGKGLSMMAVLAAYDVCVKDLEKLLDQLEEIEELTKEQLAGLAENIDVTWMTTRARARSNRTTSVDFFEYEATITDTIRRIKECVDAEQESCHDTLLLSSMAVETLFSTFTWQRNKYRKNMENPLLFLSILGSSNPGILASVDTTALAKAFLNKPD